jgi:hypothetical protein
MIEIITARPTHIGPIATRMRDIDRMECAAVCHSPKDALRQGLMTSSVVWTALIDGRPEAMFGAVPISEINGKARIWLLMTDKAAEQQVALVRLGWKFTMACHVHYPILENYVHARNDVAIRWLSRLGYAVGAVDVINGVPMRGFVRVQKATS